MCVLKKKVHELVLNKIESHLWLQLVCLQFNGAYICDREGHGANKTVHAVSLLQFFCWKNMRVDPASHATDDGQQNWRAIFELWYTDVIRSGVA